MTVSFTAENSQLMCLVCRTVFDDITINSIEKGQGEKVSICAVMSMTCPNCKKQWRQTVISEEI
jgi:hypothetical protein